MRGLGWGLAWALLGEGAGVGKRLHHALHKKMHRGGRSPSSDGSIEICQGAKLFRHARPSTTYRSFDVLFRKE